VPEKKVAKSISGKPQIVTSQSKAPKPRREVRNLEKKGERSGQKKFKKIRRPCGGKRNGSEVLNPQAEKGGKASGRMSGWKRIRVSRGK